MNTIINYWYKNQAFLYKILLFIGTVLFIVYLFPKSGKFKYNFDKGKPWQSENLYAPFDFAIQKTKTSLTKEKEDVIANSVVYFNSNKDIANSVYLNYKTQFETLFLTSTASETEKKQLYDIGQSLLNRIYKFGIIKQDYNYPPEKQVVILQNKTQKNTTIYSKLMRIGDIVERIEVEFNKKGISEHSSTMASLFFDILKPNLIINESLTNKVLNEALGKVSTVQGSVEKGTLIISKGVIVDANKYIILKSLESEYKSKNWSASSYYWVVIAYLILVGLSLLMLLLFLRKYRIEIFSDNVKVTFIFFNITLMVLLTTLVVNYNVAFVYVVPVSILPLVLKAFFDARLGLFAHVLTVLLLGLVVPNSYEYMFLQIIAGIVTILTISELYKRANLFITVGQITSVYAVSYFSFYIIHEGGIVNMPLETYGMFILCSLATLFVQPLIYIYEKLFGLVSDVSLLELSDTNSKLLKELADKAPGTFHHSLNVANLAESSANEIGANAMLVRVGALYHDIGKLRNPSYFTENQAASINPHNELSPQESAKIIINHVLDGIEIAKKHNLPDRVIDFIRTHHGTSLVYYFYMKEKEQNINLNESHFRYPGPMPFSKETALLMMCDSVEAASKSLKEPSGSKIDAFVENLIKKQMDDGQFLNASITFKEIEIVKKVLKNKLANMFHLRIEYPE